jgi:tRNA modification GTPase
MTQKQRHLDPAGYLSNRTIVALCSPTGGALTVIRLSGEQAHEIAERLTGTPVVATDERRAIRRWLQDRNGLRLDDAVVVHYFAPRSFTGESVTEFFIHGSPMIAQKVIDESVAAGARVALPGEFSFRAVKNGRMQLSQAEAVKELIQADNDFSLSLALDKLSGTQHEFIQKIQADLLQLVTLSEVGIDFSDQDLDEVSLPTLKKRALSVLTLLDRLGGSFDRGKRFTDGIPLALFGLPNAGKSSFFNALLGEDRSIVSDIAGTTRDVVREKIHLRTESGDSNEGVTVSYRMADTAGIRKSEDRIEGMGIERSVKSAQDADVLVVVIDGETPGLAELADALGNVELKDKSLLGVITKRDRISTDTMERLLNAVPTELPVQAVRAVSSTTLEGIHEVAATLAAIGADRLKRQPGEVLLTQFEHVQAVRRAIAGLKRAGETTDIVLFATETRHAMNELGPLLGETVPDDVLGKIFSDFCIGK